MARSKIPVTLSARFYEAKVDMQNVSYCYPTIRFCEHFLESWLSLIGIDKKIYSAKGVDEMIRGGSAKGVACAMMLNIIEMNHELICCCWSKQSALKNIGDEYMFGCLLNYCSWFWNMKCLIMWFKCWKHLKIIKLEVFIPCRNFENHVFLF